MKVRLFGLPAGLLALALVGMPAAAQLRSPEAFLGYAPGARFTPHHRVVDYVEHVAAHSPRVRMETYGQTYEGRPLVVAYVASPENLARLDDIRQANLRRARLAPGADPGPAGPVLVWLSYNVHGNEAAGTEAALATLYDLANPADARTGAWLDSVVVVLDPCLNPDGRERYVGFYTGQAGLRPNPLLEAREHAEPWPGGRVNHYLFDLNRDWAWQVQAETRARVALYGRWMPQVHVDFHEQGIDAPYYFSPAAEPFHAAVTPWQRQFQETIGRNHTRYFDARGWLYFTREVFDLFYPSYGDTWPTFNGAIGMTYEQGGSGRAGLAVETAEGDTLTLAERVAHHHTTGLSTVEVAAGHRRALLEAFGRYFRTPPDTPWRAFIVRAEGNPPARLAALARYLDRRRIAYGHPEGGRRLAATAYATDRDTTLRLDAADLVVPVDQPMGTLAAVLFEPQPALSDSLTYDLTAWALPYVFGLDAYATRTAVGALSPFDTTRAPAATATDAPRPYAWLLPWEEPSDAALLSALLTEGLRVRFALQPFETGGRTWKAGTLVVTRAGNERLADTFDARVRRLAARFGREATAVPTGFVTRGTDFGSENVRPVGRPRVAVLAGEAISPNALGEVWHHFDEVLAYPATLLDPARLSAATLHDYDVLVLPAGDYERALPEARLAALRAWVRDGGRLVALESAAAYLAGKDGFGLRLRPDSADAPPRAYAERSRADLSDEVPGSIYRLRLDPTHPLAFGYPDRYFTLRTSARAFAPLADGWNVGVVDTRYGREGLLSGFAGHRVRQRLSDALVFGVEDAGRGAVVYLSDNPLFRGFWYQGHLLFANAVFFVGR